MVDVLLVSLSEALNAQNDLLTGNSELKDVNEASDRFIKALESKIDKCISLNIEERKKFKKENLAPPPLDELYWNDSYCVQEWFNKYKNWYSKRKL